VLVRTPGPVARKPRESLRAVRRLGSLGHALAGGWHALALRHALALGQALVLERALVLRCALVLGRARALRWRAVTLGSRRGRHAAGIGGCAAVPRVTRPRILRPSAFVLAHAPASLPGPVLPRSALLAGTSWPAGRPVDRSVSRAAWSRTAAAAASTT